MERIGLIAAMPLESNALLHRVKPVRRWKIGSFNAEDFHLGDRECTLVTSGMGFTNASEATRLLIEKIHPTCIFSFGIAGAVRKDLQIGDVVLVHQNAILKDGALSTCQPLYKLSTAAVHAAERALSDNGVRFIPGTAVTTQGSQAVLHGQDLLNPILEMETAGILLQAQACQLPLIALRSMSDNPQAPIPLDLTSVMDEKSRLIPMRLLKELIRHPGIILQAGDLMKNSRIAAENAALAVWHILEQNEKVFSIQ